MPTISYQRGKVCHEWQRGDLCLNCGTVRRRLLRGGYEIVLFRVPGGLAWIRCTPDCAAVAADKMRLC